MTSRLIYLPLGGAGEIGMNAYVYGYGYVPERFRHGSNTVKIQDCIAKYSHPLVVQHSSSIS